MRGLLRVVVLFAAPFALAACPKTALHASDDAAAVALPDAGAPGAAAVIAEADVRAALDRWLVTQNDGKVADYEALYAPRFEGVRRSGAQTARLDRERWMIERRRMFSQKMVVAIRDVVIRASRDAAEADFVQTWSAGTYSDEGPKRIVFTASKGQKDLLIAREEMLRSSVLPSGDAPSPERFVFVAQRTEPPLRGPGPPLLVVARAVREEWMTGAPRLRVLNTDTVTTERAVDASKLPADLAAWSGREVELFDHAKGVCTGKVTGFVVLGRVIPHFSARGRWKHEGDLAEGPTKPTDTEIAREAFAMAGSGGSDAGYVLAAKVGAPRGLTGDGGPCRGALWARPVGSALPVLVGSSRADASTTALALAALRTTPAWRAVQTTYAAEKSATGPAKWDDYDPRRDARSFAFASGETIVTLSLSAGSGCGEFGATLAGVWRLEGGTLVLLREPEDETLEPLSAGDVDGDGQLDLVFSEGLMRGRAGKLGGRYRLTIPMLDCGC